MSNEEILEGNKLIAEFMGAKSQMVDHTEGNEDYLKSIGETQWLIETWSKPDGLPENVGWGRYQLGEFSYNSSWDWLMLVVEKIEKLEYPDIQNYSSIYFNRFKYGGYIYWSVNGSADYGDKKRITTTISTNKDLIEIKSLYLCCIEFIKWYNNQNNK